MTMQLKIDASDLGKLATVVGSLPSQMQRTVLARAFKRTGELARTQIVRQAAKDSGLPTGAVRSATRIFYSNEGATIGFRETWMLLHKLGGAVQTGRGTRVAKWGPHKSAFIAKMASGHVGVFTRVGKPRLKIRELFGPNPVAEVFQAPSTYEDILARVIAERLAPQVLHEMEFLLRKAK